MCAPLFSYYPRNENDSSFVNCRGYKDNSFCFTPEARRKIDRNDATTDGVKDIENKEEGERQGDQGNLQGGERQKRAADDGDEGGANDDADSEIDGGINYCNMAMYFNKTFPMDYFKLSCKYVFCAFVCINQ